MTIIEAITEDLRPYPVRKSLIERKCLKHGLNTESSSYDETLIAKIVIEILVQMLSLNNVGEGGVSISFEKEGVQEYIRMLCSDNGLDYSDYISGPTVTVLGDI